jgi:hypothetical protein
MQLTPAILEAAYAYLAETPPFDGWNMPSSEDVKFTATRNRACHGRCLTYPGEKFEIEISAKNHTHTCSLLSTMAHEMVHVHERQTGMRKNGNIHHNKVFIALAKEVCDAHGFDPGQF